MPRVAIGNNKGGSGKTAATVGLAAALAEAGHRVLIVDVDPQANASRRLGLHFDPAAPVPTTCEVVADGTDGVATGAIQPAGWPAPYGDLVDVIPSRFDLENRVSEAAVLGAHARLRRALDGADDGYTVTLLDCPPSLGHLTQLALAAADVALCTVEPEYDSVEGAVRFRDFTTANGVALGAPTLRIAGYLVSRVRAQVGAHAFQLDGLADTFGTEAVWTPHVPERAAIKDAADTAVPLRVLGGATAASLAEVYAELAARLVKELSA
jgi:cellulose biosynthesis protein BcsQ